MKQDYIELVANVIYFDESDVITASAGDDVIGEDPYYDFKN